MIIGFDLDGVVCVLPFGIKQIYKSNNEVDKIFGWLQHLKVLQRFYNLTLRKANRDICLLMRKFKEMGHRVIIVSASAECTREEVSRWLKKNEVPFDKLYLKSFFPESIISFKRRILEQDNCFFYLEDIEEIVEGINSLGAKRAHLYDGSDSLKGFLLALDCSKAS